MKKRIIFLILAVAALLAFVWMLNYRVISNKNGEKLSVVATLFPYYDFAKIVGGDKAEVSLLLPPGIEAHSFEPKPSDIFKINSADIFVYTGDFMEPWAKDILIGINNKKLSVVKAGDVVSLLNGSDEGLGSGADPHIWLDLLNSENIVDGILTAFVKKDPQNSDFYIQNAHNLKNELKDLDNSFKAGLSNCQTKTLIYGGHYAFGYLVKRYGLNYLAAQGFAPDSEPTARDLANLINELKKNNVGYVFYEELSSPKIAETISEETGAKLLLLNTAEKITKEDLNNNVSFIDIIKEDLVNLKTGLGCQ
ncbi:MAG: zinc ABC transporter substrate-binding protein [bacterium]|nr:zinc ABC transporter substrate-binding protein [bacterium]